MSAKSSKRVLVVAIGAATAVGGYLVRKLAAQRNAEILRRHAAQPEFVPEPRANDDLPVDVGAVPRAGDAMEDLAPLSDRGDEEAEIRAAAAEAAAIGGEPEPVFDEDGEPAAEAERPLYEAGQGYAEGAEQTEAQVADVIAEGADEQGQRRGRRLDRELAATDGGDASEAPTGEAVDPEPPTRPGGAQDEPSSSQTP
jgi:hypothetical protein